MDNIIECVQITFSFFFQVRQFFFEPKSPRVYFMVVCTTITRAVGAGLLERSPPAGVSCLGVPGVPWHTQILADQLTLFHTGGTDYAHLITTATPGFSDLPTALQSPQILEDQLTLFIQGWQFCQPHYSSN